MAGDEASRYLAKSLYNHGFANELQRASEDRIEPFLREAIELDPTYIDAMSCLGTLCLRTGRVDEGLGWLGKCTELDPGAGQGWYYQAKHHLGAKDSEKAAYFAGRAGDAYHAARQYQFEGDARDIEGFAYRDLGKLREAKAAYERAYQCGHPTSYANCEQIDELIALEDSDSQEASTLIYKITDKIEEGKYPWFASLLFESRIGSSARGNALAVRLKNEESLDSDETDWLVELVESGAEPA